MQITQILHNTAQKYASKAAIIFKDQTISFTQLEENVLRLAGLLQSKGIAKGDKVAIYLPNCPEYVYSYLAIFQLGAVGVPLDYMLKPEELTSCLDHSETKLLIALPKKEFALDDLKLSVKSLKSILPVVSFPTVTVPADRIDVNIVDSDPSLIMYTSGTTGKPKGILLNYKHLHGSPEAMKHFVDLTDKDIKLVAIPFSHIGGFVYIQNCLWYGITLVLMERFNPFEFLANIAKYQVTCFHIVPAMYTAILTMKEIERFDLSSLRWIVVFGAPSSPDIMERFHKYCPKAKLLNGWGMTETCPPNTVTPLTSTKIESIGKPSPISEIKIFDENDKEVPVGQIGEIVIRGWVVMDGYYKDEEATRELKRNGWFHTGDLGRYDAEGFLYIVGRKKEMIKVAGQIVYAPEVESAFYKNENIAEVAVIGIPDKMRGESVKAFVVLKEGAQLTEKDLFFFAKEHLANFKVPQSIDIRKELPKNRTGKIDKEMLKVEAGLKTVPTN